MEFASALPLEAKDLDTVVNVLFYHDFEWMEVDRAAHNRAIFAALTPGGRCIIVDAHGRRARSTRTVDAHAKLGAGANGSKTLHRIEESLVITELEAAGFELVRRGAFVGNPDDTRDWNALPWVSDTGVSSDKFVLEVRKPAK